MAPTILTSSSITSRLIALRMSVRWLCHHSISSTFLRFRNKWCRSTVSTLHWLIRLCSPLIIHSQLTFHYNCVVKLRVCAWVSAFILCTRKRKCVCASVHPTVCAKAYTRVRSWYLIECALVRVYQRAFHACVRSWPVVSVSTWDQRPTPVTITLTKQKNPSSFVWSKWCRVYIYAYRTL